MVTSTSCSAAMRSSSGATGAPWRHSHTCDATRCVCMESASAVAPQWRPSSRSMAHSSACDAPPPPSSAGTPAEKTRCSLSSR